MDEPLALTREQSRRVDAIAIERYRISGMVLMENAGRGVVDVLLESDPALGLTTPPAPSPRRGGLGRGEHDSRSSPSCVAILCGKGNNAGDGFVIARHLAIRGVRATTLLLCSPDDLHGDARTNFDILSHAEVPVVELVQLGVDSLTAALDQYAGGAAWLVDAMLGTGAQGEPREPIRTAIGWMNAQPGRRLAVDVPSGLDCDSGQAATATVRADVTCTFVAAKVGFLKAEAREFVGEVRVVSIGVPARLLRDVVET